MEGLRARQQSIERGWVSERGKMSTTFSALDMKNSNSRIEVPKQPCRCFVILRSHGIVRTVRFSGQGNHRFFVSQER
ncbi:MAG: hypothetical protein EWM72_00600 [Nitrospira sp.]|nr:MAG: hypothetical protein EWM72_00600 [Nitrospira sp.]